MKKLIIGFGVIAILASCKAYQVNTVSSINTKLTDSTGVFKKENDSLIIRYSFVGDNSPLHVEVYNKMNEPVYVNWGKSAIIVGENAYNFSTDEISIQGSASSVSIPGVVRGDRYSDTNLSATAKLPSSESFIPPHSKVMKTTYALRNAEMTQIEKSDYKRLAMNYTDGSGQTSVKEANFTLENSPLKFKSYLTLYTLKDNQPQAIAFQEDFYISRIIKSSVSPNDLYEFSNNPGNLMIKSQSTGYAKTMAVFGMVGAVGALTTAQSALNDKENRK